MRKEIIVGICFGCLVCAIIGLVSIVLHQSQQSEIIKDYPLDSYSCEDIANSVISASYLNRSREQSKFLWFYQQHNTLHQKEDVARYYVIFCQNQNNTLYDGERK